MSRIGFIQDELDLKLLVLYIMARTAAPITFLQLLDLALCDAGVDYFSLTQSVDHLVTTGNLAREDEERYSITDKGRRNSDICEDALPYSVRMRCDENLVKLNDMLRRQEQVQAQVTPNEDGTCQLRLYFSDGNEPFMELNVLIPTQKQGESIAARFHSQPEVIYHQMIALLSDEAEN